MKRRVWIERVIQLLSSDQADKWDKPAEMVAYFDGVKTNKFGMNDVLFKLHSILV